MASAFLLLLLVVISTHALYEERFKQSYDTSLEKKCEALNMRYPAAFVGDRCFAATPKTYSVDIKDWHNLKKHCTHLYGYHSQMGNIFCEAQLDKLMEADVLENSKKYFVGARQSPTDEDAGIQCCGSPEHKKNWKYFDSEGKVICDLNPAMWLKDQPDNSGVNPPEFVVAIEKLNVSNKLGFNDINPSADKYAVLCEYTDYLSCSDDWTLVGDSCFKVFTEHASIEDAQSKCSREKGTLASIHNDKTNHFITLIANDAFKRKRISEDDKELSHNPVLFGLIYGNDGYKYDNGDHVDFFRWYDKAGMGIPKRNSGVLLNTYVTGAKGEPRFTYWTVADSRKEYPFVCQADPKVTNI